jgi:membrane-associated protease RseP (regulator of RpoE activity)
MAIIDPVDEVDDYDSMEPTPAEDIATTQEMAQRRYPTAPMGVPAQPMGGAIPVAQQQFDLSSSYHLVGAPPPPPDDTLAKVAKSIVAICAGLAAVGAIVWILGKQFFTTKDEYTADQKQRDTFQTSTISSQVNLQRSLDELIKEVKNQGLSSQETQKDVAVIKALMARRRHGD